MAKMVVNEDQFQEFLNQLLKEQDGVTPDMRFVAAPAGTKGTAMLGYDTTTPFTSHPAYANTVKLAHELYEVLPTKR